MRGASVPAFCGACSTPVSEMSMSVTSQPCFASQIAWRPAPPAKSSAFPPLGNAGRMYSKNARGRKGSGSSQASGASRYFWFQCSRSLEEDGMLCDSSVLCQNQPGGQLAQLLNQYTWPD